MAAAWSVPAEKTPKRPQVFSRSDTMSRDDYAHTPGQGPHRIVGAACGADRCRDHDRDVRRGKRDRRADSSDVSVEWQCAGGGLHLVSDGQRPNGPNAAGTRAIAMADAV